MIDGRGRARITDFGLAVAAGEATEGEVVRHAGLHGARAARGQGRLGRGATSTRSASCSTSSSPGARPSTARRFQELKRKHAEDPPACALDDRRPTSIRSVERVILRCLEKDPGGASGLGARRSPRRFRAAIRSPRRSPRARRRRRRWSPPRASEGALAPAKAWTLLGVTLALVAGLVVISRYATDQGVAPFPKSPDALEDRAREVVQSLGYTAPPADSATWWERQYEYLTYRAGASLRRGNLRELAAAQPHPWWFWYRQSPRDLVPRATATSVRSNDPPFEVSGMVARRARRARQPRAAFARSPPQVEPPGVAPAPDWKPLFDAAGLDPARFTPSVPRWLPGEPFDARADWDGAYASTPSVPIHVSAAAWRGRPVSFEIIGPWSVPGRMQATPARGRGDRARRGDSLHHPVDHGRRRARGAPEPAHGARRSARGVPRLGLRVRPLPGFVALPGAPRSRAGRRGGPLLPGDRRRTLRRHPHVDRLRRDRADRAPPLAGPSLLVEPGARGPVPRSARRARRARGPASRIRLDAGVRPVERPALLVRSARDDARAAGAGAPRRNSDDRGMPARNISRTPFSGDSQSRRCSSSRRS